MKQVIVVRKDLNMRKGKIASQVAHASLKVFFDRIVNSSTLDQNTFYTFQTNTYEKEWIEGSFAKICVSVNSETELEEIYNKALELKIPCSLIIDEGRTEFNGVATKTTVAIGPADNDIINSITGKLPLL